MEYPTLNSIYIPIDNPTILPLYRKTQSIIDNNKNLRYLLYTILILIIIILIIYILQKIFFIYQERHELVKLLWQCVDINQQHTKVNLPSISSTSTPSNSFITPISNVISTYIPSPAIQTQPLACEFVGNGIGSNVPINQSLIRSMPAETLMSCASKCVDEPQCRAYGYLDNGSQRCDLYDYYNNNFSYDTNNIYNNYQVGTKFDNYTQKITNDKELNEQYNLEDTHTLFGINDDTEIAYQSNINNQYECASLCTIDSKCVAYSFNNDERICSLFHTQASKLHQESQYNVFTGKKRTMW